MIRKYSLLIVILLFAAVLRGVRINEMPPALNWDEVSHGYNAYSVLQTGKDEWGIKLPTIFRAYGDYKLPVYIYLTAVSEKFLGLSEVSVRLPSVLAGIGTVLFTYLIVLNLFKNKTWAGMSAFLVAIEPWSLFLSRGAFEANLALFFILAGVYFYLTDRLSVSIILMGLSVWTYNSARIFTPLILLSLILIYRKKFKLPQIILVILFFVPMFVQLLSPAGQARYGKVSIINQGSINKIIDLRSKSKINGIVPRLIYNKVTFFTVEFGKNYFSHFSPDFLYFKGGTNYQFSVQGRGILYPINIAFIVTGIWWAVRNRSKSTYLLLTWILLAPIPSSLTNEAPHVLRSIVMIPIPMVLTAIGVSQLLKKTRYIAIYVVVLLLMLENYATVYATSYRENYSWSWQYGYKQAVTYAKSNYQKYDKIIITKKYGEAHEFFLFYWPWNPANYQSDKSSIKFFQSDWWWVDGFDKFYFVNDWDVPIMKLESGGKVDCTGKIKCLLITSPNNVPNGWKKLDTINFLDDKKAFEIYEN